MDYKITFNGHTDLMGFSQLRHEYNLTMSEQIKVANLKPGEVLTLPYAKPVVIERLP